MKKIARLKSANVALTTVIVVSAILLFSGVSLVLTSIDLGLASRDFHTSVVLTGGLNSCFEEALAQISANASYTGSVNMSTESFECTAVVIISGENSNWRVITLTSSKNGYTDTATKTIDASQPKLPLVK